ncbi:bifunctional pyrazinamidase/nicotinamidase [Desulfuromonas versatilis]|uniref:nicotinamidase n=1 Tax=Desulfuromonas versatilis TaxID=2802975 RepID=A0ABM8HLX7_9BACT|nr:isochorismatase family protein [Desulfuromonas versatilis]BCR03172.1 bifunctional pyrazinamidase/nicotinamidase [Desulfuromonas versatilis]
MTPSPSAFAPGDLLLLVDVQVDFCPGGALPIENGDQVVPVLNGWIQAAVETKVPIYASRDWHPTGHISFAESGGQWPVHCLQDTPGAAFHPALQLPTEAVVVTKGNRFDQDQNSAFDQTGLAFWLKKKGIKRLFVGGLAQDVCVLATVLDALKEGFAVNLLVDGTRPVTEEGGRVALAKMAKAGAQVMGG